MKTIHLLKHIPNRSYFKIVKKDGSLSNLVYTKIEYDRSEKKYLVLSHNDILGAGRYLKGDTIISLQFTY